MLGLIVMGGQSAAGQALLKWEQWVHVPAIFDVVGPRTDGRLLAQTGGRLVLIDRTGAVAPFADGPGGYPPSDPNTESYLALSPGARVAGAACTFPADDAFVIELRLGQPRGILRIDSSSRASSFVTVPGDDLLNGIVFDNVGRFDNRLLVTAVRDVQGQRRGVVRAIDCKGAVEVLTESAPVFEGGIAVAPASFGSHGGELVVPDEESGKIYAVDPRGSVSLLVESGIPAGGDIGVESLGFVPPGFGSGGFAYVADRATPNNPHPGTDSLLRLRAADLAAADVAEGDLLVASEGGAVTIAVRCAPACVAQKVAEGSPAAHVEGHVVFVVDGAAIPSTASTSAGLPTQPGPPRGRSPVPVALLAGGAVVAAAALGLVIFRRRASR